MPLELSDSTVHCVRVTPASYDAGIRAAVGALFRSCALDSQATSTASWNPLGEVIPAGARVLLKPNWVLHANHAGLGEESLITHPALIEAVFDFVLRARPAAIVLGDAPVQGCDFDRMLRIADGERRFDAMRARAAAAGVDFRIEDFRRVTLADARIENRSDAVRRDDADYVVFDLAEQSALEPITAADTEFRVTMYDPSALRRTHGPGTHRYLIAREAIDADVVINLPKLKTHKKAGVTGALKNMVGINGHKEYLPHHRKGGSDRGGDCYGGDSLVKRVLESMMDTANGSAAAPVRLLLDRAQRAVVKGREALGVDANVEGSWHGNDTVWRMCLDLQAILHYGRTDGTLAAEPQRRVITLTDAVIAGEGEGPLAPSPVPLGLLTLAGNVAAAEWVHAALMGFEPERIPLLLHAFTDAPRPLAPFAPADVRVQDAESRYLPADYAARHGLAFRPPLGWKGHCERASVMETA